MKIHSSMATLALLLVLASFSLKSQDMTVQQNSLGNLVLQTEPIEAVESFSGQRVVAEAAVLPGRSYIFKSPINIQQIEYLKGVGEKFQKNEPFALISGPEVHHFYMAYQMKKGLFEQAQSYLEHSKQLYQQKSISEGSWLAASEQYFDSKMEFDELTHFFDLVLGFDEDNETITLAAPITGFIFYDTQSTLDIDTLIGSFTPPSALRVKVNLPIEQQLNPLYIQIGDCKLDIAFTENANSAFSQTAWSQAFIPGCDFSRGQMLSAIPEYQISAYKIAQSSVFNWEGENYIFIQKQQAYQAIKVDLIASQDTNFIVTADTSLNGKIALISSVSALQGMLQGLGL